MDTDDLVEIKEKLNILKDKNTKVFSEDYVPDEIHFRDNEIRIIVKNLAGNHNVYLIGNIGTGKTAIIKWIINNLKKLNNDDDTLYIYQSCRLKSFNDVWYSICKSIGIKASRRQSIATYSAAIYDHVKNNNIKKIILVLDEADEVSGRYNDPDLLYLFGETSYFICILIGNTQEWINNIGIRTSSRLGGDIISLIPYNEFEIREILRQRVELSSKDTPISIIEIETIAKKVIERTVSLRDAIKVMSKIYDYKKFNKKTDDLSEKMIVKFFKQVKDDSLIKYYNSQPPVLRYVIVCATLILSKNKDKSFNIKQLTDIFNKNVNEKVGRKSMSSIRGYLKELETYGFFKEDRRSRGKTGYNLVYSPRFDVEEFEIFFKTERIIK